MTSRRILGLALAVALGGFGATSAPANAGTCDVNVGPGATCGPNGDCEVNVAGNCQGDCTVNVAATCNAGASCTINVVATCGTSAVAVSGTGTINPGLPCPPSGCTIHLDFTAVFANGANGSASCTFDGIDNFPGGATVLAGQGGGTINCAGDVSANGAVTFSRTLTAVDVDGSITVDSVAGCVVNVTLAFYATTPPPVTTFGVVGGGTVTCP